MYNFVPLPSVQCQLRKTHPLSDWVLVENMGVYYVGIIFPYSLPTSEFTEMQRLRTAGQKVFATDTIMALKTRVDLEEIRALMSNIGA